MQTLGTPRLTDILSRDSSLARNAATLPHAADDRVLGRCGVIVFDPERQSGRTMDDLITAVSRGRTFAVDEGRGLEIQRLPHALGVARSVCYVNTDLNDFGRGNDLRESPKDLDRDFKAQMVDRLEIEIDPQTACFRYFEELKRAADAVLSTPLENFSDRRVIPPGFDLQNLTVSGDRVGIWIDRRDGQRPVSINFLSAGENEVLFIYLMVLNFTNNFAKGASIILLDEPDLHIANVSHYRFFEEVLRLTDGRAQLIMSTHSPAAYEMFRSKYRNADLKTKVLLRILPHEDSSTTKLFASFDGIYLGRLRRMNYTGGLMANLRHFVDLTAAKIRSVAPVSTYAASAATLTWLFAVLMVVLLTLGAVSNDVLNNDRIHWAWRRLLFFGMSPVRYHDETLRYWLTFGPTSILAPLALLWLRSMSHRRHQKKLERFREAVRARAL
jgi:putative AbiEii toxin of type IV toxin-antitoxin system